EWNLGRIAAAQLRGERQLLHRRALPLDAVRRNRARAVRRGLLLVPQGDRTVAGREAGASPLRAHPDRNQPDVLPDVPPGRRRDAQTRVGLRGVDGLAALE